MALESLSDTECTLGAFFSVTSPVSDSLFDKTVVKQQCNAVLLQEERLDVNNI